MINKKFFVFQLIFAILIAVSFSGCTDDASDSEYDSQSSSSSNINENLKIKELVANQNEIWSYSYDYTMNSKVNGRNIEMSGTGKVDTNNKNAYLSLESENGSIEYYYFEGAMYMGTILNGESQWMKVLSEGEDFESNFDVLSQYNESIYNLENNDFTLDGEETVNGIPCYKVRMNVEDMYDTMASEYNVEEGEVSDWDMAEITYYISKSYGYIVKTTANIKGTDKSGESFEINYVLSLKNINEIQDIELPDDAENAVDISSYYSNYQ
uniref:Lipoprotein n=1 Tax=Methanococcus maripaludis (strain C6 / ATCC BAA-1332) TaxID=444158 RepID=A9A9I8_METM6